MEFNAGIDRNQKGLLMVRGKMIFKRKMGRNGEIIIPKTVRDIWGVKKGDIIVLEVINNELWIRPEK